MKLTNTPVTEHQFDDIAFFLKRDDQMHPQFSGNKARKFMALLDHDDPKITTLIGYGSPQANSLYSMAALASLKGWQLEFYVDHIPTWLKSNPIGNYRAALELGADIIAVSESGLHPHEYIHTIRKPNEDSLFVPEGGRCGLAEAGVKQLAQELIDWITQQTNSQSNLNFVVALPSGTGTTALYLNKYLAPLGIEVLTCACVGGSDYLRHQFAELNEPNLPTILELEYKHHFGKLYSQDFIIWQQILNETNIEFDLLYDPMMWQCLQSWKINNPDKQILYVHQGGLLGNESMLPRYQRKYSPQ
ncbi:1-aminocyclopropane-1-carboxylate deaminase/D-cysteine desulfhydrase [Vibrio sinensis]|uniref:1-aminocyclopropane-1-carboxylate deaminase/D-cysteine desulfhydrase n=1 Tax=Vibrio sinensis TaxID=2302434 RepID=A0A3A6QYN5_9VIBR|nr:1-aminocyclopropane-1-carboxylate deaminase/D-cysteine desulfhydrase [Vibrio sinensis]RJX73609.1 1-aminocyclopropane-1-carboxylate deaminase/D-cysteine desulfhydrase [Vibrio sinensis]